MSYYMQNAVQGYRGFGGFGELFYESGKAFYRVQSVAGGGETVSSIAQKVYKNASVWPDICKYNTSIGVPMDPKTPKGDCWYKVGTVLELPKIPGYPDPMESAPKSGISTLQPGQTIVKPDGTVATIGAGGQVTSKAPPSAFASMSTGTKVAIAVAALAGVGLLAMAAKKKKGARPSTGAAPGMAPVAA